MISFKVHEYAMTLRSDGLFPTVFTNAKIDKVAMLKILNFYPETAENRKKANLEVQSYLIYQ